MCGAYGQQATTCQKSASNAKQLFLMVQIVSSRENGSPELALSMEKVEYKRHKINHLATTYAEWLLLIAVPAHQFFWLSEAIPASRTKIGFFSHRAFKLRDCFSLVFSVQLLFPL